MIEKGRSSGRTFSYQPSSTMGWRVHDVKPTYLTTLARKTNSPTVQKLAATSAPTSRRSTPWRVASAN
jgi:hypothetical protein